jgi:hypothetical protein
MTDSHSHESETGREPVGRRALVPREHGAYVELVFPLATALLLGSPNAAQLLVALAAVLVFLAHEPVLVLAGGRGSRAFGELKERAVRRAGSLAAAAFLAGAVGLWAAPRAARIAFLLPIILAAFLVPLIFSRREKTLAGELLVAFALSSASIPVAMAGGVAATAALTAGSIWAAIFLLETVTVRAVRANFQERIRAQGSFRAIIVEGFGAIISAALLALSGVFPPLAGAAIVPAALVAVTAGWIRIHPRNLRALGWSFAASNLIALAALLSALSSG